MPPSAPNGQTDLESLNDSEIFSFTQEGACCVPVPWRDADLIERDDALTVLAEVDPRKARVGELKFFGGLNLKEIAEVLKVSEDTVWRDWDLAKCWLYREMKRAARRQ